MSILEQLVKNKEALSNYYDSSLIAQYGVAEPDLTINYGEDEEVVYSLTSIIHSN